MGDGNCGAATAQRFCDKVSAQRRLSFKRQTMTTQLSYDPVIENTQNQNWQVIGDEVE